LKGVQGFERGGPVKLLERHEEEKGYSKYFTREEVSGTIKKITPANERGKN